MAPKTYKLRLDSEQLAAWQKAADTAGLKLAEWMRRKCDGDESTDAQDVPRVPDAPSGGGDTFAGSRIEVDPSIPPVEIHLRDSAGTVHKIVNVGTKTPKSPHPGGGLFNAPTDLFEPAYKSHPSDCRCMICESAIKAGLKEDRRPKKNEEKKPAKRGRR